MSSINTVKSYALELARGYDSALNRIKKRYDALSGALDEKYLERDREIVKERDKNKNRASASYTVDRARAQASLYEKGLERSGESVNTDIRYALAKNGTFADLDAAAERERNANAISRAEEKSKLIAERLDAEAELERGRLSALKDAEDAEEERRRWELERSDRLESELRESELEAKRLALDIEESEHERLMEEKKLSSSNAQKDRELALKEAESKFDRLMEEKRFGSSEDQRERENAFDEEELELEKRKIALEEWKALLDAVDKGDAQGSKGSGGDGGSKSDDESERSADGAIPEYSPKELVDAIYKAYNARFYKSEKSFLADIGQAVRTVLNDTTLDSNYKLQVRVLATALGYLD